jgi:hypothetical protein
MVYTSSIHTSTHPQNIQSVRLSSPVVQIGPPPPSLAHKGVLLPLPLGPNGGTLAYEGEGPDSDDRADSLVLYVYYIPSTPQPQLPLPPPPLVSNHRVG